MALSSNRPSAGGGKEDKAPYRSFPYKIRVPFCVCEGRGPADGGQGSGAGRRREAEESRQQAGGSKQQAVGSGQERAGGRRKERVWRIKRDGWPGKRKLFGLKVANVKLPLSIL
jgi:hypothetical protein